MQAYTFLAIILFLISLMVGNIDRGLLDIDGVVGAGGRQSATAIASSMYMQQAAAVAWLRDNPDYTGIINGDLSDYYIDGYTGNYLADTVVTNEGFIITYYSDAYGGGLTPELVANALFSKLDAPFAGLSNSTGVTNAFGVYEINHPVPAGTPFIGDRISE